LEAGLISDIALVVTAIGVLGVVIGLRQSYRERLRQFEGKYVERYWEILDQLSLQAFQGSFNGEVCESDEKAIRRYISLCEDELEMRQYGYIADSTYELWAEGMRFQLEESLFSNVWKQVQKENEAKSITQYVYLRKLMLAEEVKAGNQSDPLEMGQSQRTLRGLRGLRGV
jgi:hypothetical protein